MSLRTIHKDRNIKTADETIAFIEKLYGTKLMPYQKLFVKAVHNSNTFIVMPVHLGYTQLINII